MSQATNTCGCEKPSFSVPVRGLELRLDEEAFDAIIGNSGAGCTCEPLDLRLGVETKVNARYRGKQVYTKLVDCGTLPNTTNRSVPHGVANIEWIQIDFGYSMIRNPGTPMWQNYSLNMPSQAPNNIISAVNSDAIRLTTYSNVYTAATAVVCIRYTKATDPIIA